MGNESHVWLAGAQRQCRSEATGERPGGSAYGVSEGNGSRGDSSHWSNTTPVDRIALERRGSRVWDGEEAFVFVWVRGWRGALRWVTNATSGLRGRRGRVAARASGERPWARVVQVLPKMWTLTGPGVTMGPQVSACRGRLLMSEVPLQSTFCPSPPTSRKDRLLRIETNMATTYMMNRGTSLIRNCPPLGPRQSPRHRPTVGS
jgi:hypothetical protein